MRPRTTPILPFPIPLFPSTFPSRFTLLPITLLSFTLIPLLLTHPLPLSLLSPPYSLPYFPSHTLSPLRPSPHLLFPPWLPICLSHPLHSLSPSLPLPFPFPYTRSWLPEPSVSITPAGRHWPAGPLILPSALPAHPLLPSPPVPHQKLLETESMSPAGSPWPDAFCHRNFIFHFILIHPCDAPNYLIKVPFSGHSGLSDFLNYGPYSHSIYMLCTHISCVPSLYNYGI